MKVFLSHQMSGLSKEEVLNIRKQMMDFLDTNLNDPDIKYIDNYTHPDIPSDAHRLLHLGRSIQQMAEADLVVFDATEFKDLKSPGCIVEYHICELYGIPYKFIHFRDGEYHQFN